MADLKPILQLAQQLRQQAVQQRQRRVLLMSGEAVWCRGCAEAIAHELVIPAQQRLWIGEPYGDIECLPNRQAKTRLGSECQLLIYDAHSGFDPDSFGAVSGTLCGGGLLLLLAPPLNQWPQFDDPEYSRLLVANYQLSQIKGRFLQHLVAELQQAEGVLVCTQGEVLPSLEWVADEPPEVCSVSAPYLSEDQQRAVTAIHHVMTGHRRRPLVITSDRGRGKSGALGLAAGQLLLQEGARRIVLSAPSREAVDSVFRQASGLLPDSTRVGNCLGWRDAELQFIAPDQLLMQRPEADLLLVDEAAAIPVAMLQGMLAHYSRVVFSSTVHGYEGSGRGFAIRFQQHLDNDAPGWQALRLKQPIRWAQNDPLEGLVFRALCLDAEATANEKLDGLTLDGCQVRAVGRDELMAQPLLLAELFGLLVNAHYRTTPNDLRNLLDGPNLTLYVMESIGEGSRHVVGVLLLAHEGGFDEVMAEQIQQGRRRPRGHLLAQTLASQLGLQRGAQLSSARVMRIAIHPAIQRCGFGAALLRVVSEECIADGVDLLGASFSASKGVLQFWQKQGLGSVLLGLGHESSSGAHSVLLLRPLSEVGSALYQQARLRGQRMLLAQLSDPLQRLEPELALCLLAQQPGLPLPSVDEQDLLDLHNFAHHQRGYELTLHVLQPLVQWGLVNHGDQLSDDQQLLLFSKVLQQRSWGECAQVCGYSGRKALLVAIRQAAQLLLTRYLASQC